MVHLFEAVRRTFLKFLPDIVFECVKQIFEMCLWVSGNILQGASVCDFIQKNSMLNIFDNASCLHVRIIN